MYFYFIWKETTHKPSKVTAAKTHLLNVYVIGTACFDQVFLFVVITRRHFFSYYFVITLRLFWLIKVFIGVSTPLPPQKHHLLSLANIPLNQNTALVPLFGQSFPLYLFSWTLQPKKQIFSEVQEYYIFPSLTSSFLLKVAKFLLKISLL